MLTFWVIFAKKHRQISYHIGAEVIINYFPYSPLRMALFFYLASLAQHKCSLVSRFLTYCPSKRILSDEGLKHEYFRESPLPIDPSMFPTWPAKSEQQRVKRGTSPRPPEGGLGYSQLVSSLNLTFSVTYMQQVFSHYFSKILQKRYISRINICFYCVWMKSVKIECVCVYVYCICHCRHSCN